MCGPAEQLASQERGPGSRSDSSPVAGAPKFQVFTQAEAVDGNVGHRAGHQDISGGLVTLCRGPFGVATDRGEVVPWEVD